MRATRINHVSIVADDLEESARFYEELFGAERIPTARFPQGRVLWLRLGEQQLHLFESGEGDGPTVHHHFGIDVDDFDAVYARAKELGHPRQRRVRHAAAEPSRPAGCSCTCATRPGTWSRSTGRDASALAPRRHADIVPLESAAPQEGEAAVATLYHS